MHAFNLPDTFVHAIIELHGDEGRLWLAGLPALVQEYAQHRRLTLVGPVAQLSYNYVVQALYDDGTEVVLKAGVPHRELFTEMDALQCYDGRGCVRLLEADRAAGLLLLECAMPGTPLSDEPDDARRIAIAAKVMRELWRPVPREHAFPTITDWEHGFMRLRERFNGGTGPLPVRLVELAGHLFTDLLASSSSTSPVLLHGDLHYGNILAATREPWLAIDPKGVVGEPAYEAGALLRNPAQGGVGGLLMASILRRRTDLLADELGIDSARIAAWGCAQAVLSAWWSIEDHGHGWEPAIACAEELERVWRERDG